MINLCMLCIPSDIGEFINSSPTSHTGGSKFLAFFLWQVRLTLARDIFFTRDIEYSYSINHIYTMYMPSIYIIIF